MVEFSSENMDTRGDRWREPLCLQAGRDGWRPEGELRAVIHNASTPTGAWAPRRAMRSTVEVHLGRGWGGLLDDTQKPSEGAAMHAAPSGY
jgi:hypothetical protein